MMKRTKILTIAALNTALLLPCTSYANYFGGEDTPDQKKNTIPVMRTGFTMSASSQADLKAKQQALYVRAIHKQAAEEAQSKAELVQHVISFKHSFLIPDWLRVILPLAVSEQLTDFDMKGVTLTYEGALAEKEAVTKALLRVNGFGENFDRASATPQAALVRLVNQAGFDLQQSPLKHAITLERLALHLEGQTDHGLADEVVHGMSGALFAQAADVLDRSVLPGLDYEIGKGYEMADLYISSAQLHNWAAFRLANPAVKLAHLQESQGLLVMAKVFGDDEILQTDLEGVIELQLKNNKLAMDYLLMQ